MITEKKILLSFDVEEFDLPLEYRKVITVDEQLKTGYRGLVEIKHLLNKKKIATTLFATAFFADNFSNDIKELSTSHEIASHTYFHSSFKDEDLKLSKEKIAANYRQRNLRTSNAANENN